MGATSCVGGKGGIAVDLEFVITCDDHPYRIEVKFSGNLDLVAAKFLRQSAHQHESGSMNFLPREAIICTYQEVVFDLSEVTAMDSAGLGFLLSLHTKRVSNFPQGIKLRGVTSNPRLKTIFRITNLNKCFAIES